MGNYNLNKKVHNLDALELKQQIEENNKKILKEIGKRNKVKFQSRYTLDTFDKKIVDIFDKITS